MRGLHRNGGEMRGVRIGTMFVFISAALVTLQVIPPGLFIVSISDRAIAAEVARYQPMSPPQISAAAVYVADITSHTELFALNPDAPLPPASLTKVVSALVVLDEASLNDRVEILNEDQAPAEESQVGLVVGDHLSVRDLLFGALIPSGNDATMALARHVGSKRLGATATPAEAVAEFVSLMNAKAIELGATSSHFVMPTGVDADGHVMTARDVAILTAAALKNSLFAEIVSTPTAVLASEIRPDGYLVTSTNLLLLEGVVNGVKTGTTPKAGGCLVTTFKVGANDIVAVVLGSQLLETSDGLQDNSARFTDTRTLIDATSTDYVWIDPGSPGAITGLVEELTVWDADLVDGIMLPVPSQLSSRLRYRLVLDPPVAADGPVGEVQFFVDDRFLSERPALQSS